MRKLLGLLILLGCSMNLYSQIDPSTYESAMISRGDNLPDFNPDDDSLKLLIVSLHMSVPAKAFQESYGWKDELYKEKIEFLRSKDYVYEKEGRFYPSCMVITDQEGKELFEYAEPIAGKISDSVISQLNTIKDQYLKTDLSKTTDFSKVSFLILSNVLLDNWQIRYVEKEFLSKERPLRHGKNYYFSFQQNLNPPRESFGIYGNGYYSGVAIFGNNRGSINLRQLRQHSKEATIISDQDDAVFEEMASSFRPILISLLKKNRNYIEDVYRKTGYANEVSFEEFFIWWYHFIYTRATNILAEKNYLTLPEQGNFFYNRSSSAPAQRSNPTLKPAAVSLSEVDQVLERYVKAVGGREALVRLSTENRKGELETGKGVFTLESYATAWGQWSLVLKRNQQSLQIQCDKTTCWRNGNQSDNVDPTTSVEIAAEFEMYFPAHLKDYFQTLQFVGKKSLDGNSVFVLEGSSPSLKPMKIAFDAQTGLLVKLGSTEFRDYRECGGIKRPFVFISPVDGKTTFSQIQHNQPIPAEVFARQPDNAVQAGSKQ
jgi:hypothetical protein